MKKILGPVELFLCEIERALDAKLYYLAIVMVLTLPDICAALENPTGTGGRKRYKEWYNKYIAFRYPYITADDIWNLRCGIVHQGRCGHPAMRYDRVVFTLPGPLRRHRNFIMGKNFIKGAYNLDAEMFCREIIESVRQWYDARQNDQNVQNNLPHMVQYRHRGFPPYVVGSPVIA